MKKKIVSVIVVILILSMFPLSAFAATMTSGAETKIGVGDSPVDVAVEPGTNYLWVVNYDGSISIVDPVGQNLIDTINVGLRIRGIIFGSEYAYITAVEGYIEVFDLETRSRDRYIQLTADYPTNMVLSPDEKTLYVTSGIPSEIAITVVDLENDAFSTITSQQGSETSDVVYDQSTGLIYAADKTNSRICVIDTSDNSISSIDTRTLAPVGLVADFANNRLYASSDSEVALIDLTSKLVIDSTTAGKGERIVRTTESRLYATSASSSKMYIFDTSDPDELNLVEGVALPLEAAVAQLVEHVSRHQVQRLGSHSGTGHACAPEDASQLGHPVLGHGAHERLPPLAAARGAVDHGVEERVVEFGHAVEPLLQQGLGGWLVEQVPETFVRARRRTGRQQRMEVTLPVDRL